MQITVLEILQRTTAWNYGITSLSVQKYRSLSLSNWIHLEICKPIYAGEPHEDTLAQKVNFKRNKSVYISDGLLIMARWLLIVMSEVTKSSFLREVFLHS
jgi:hypothetical protein